MLRGSLLICTALFCAALLASAAVRADDWREDARRFTGESAAVRARAIERLRKDAGLRAKLEAALETRDRSLAYDVISALRLRELLPRLLELAERDASGFAYHVINSILAPADAPEVLRIYRERLDSAATPLASRVALLDSLARTSRGLSPARVLGFLREEAPELRAAALGYARKRLLKHGEFEFLPAVRAGLDDARYVIRVQAHYLVGELGGAGPRGASAEKWRAEIASLAADAATRCRADARLAREAICGGAGASYGGGHDVATE